jgi:hypothetical protein
MTTTKIEYNKNYRKLLCLFGVFTVYNFLTCLVVAKVIGESNPKLLASTFGDFYRSDLFAVLVQGNFTSPWEYHPEVPNISSQAYFPFPFLVMKLFGIKVINFGPTLFFVQILTIGSITAMNYAMWVMLKKYSLKFRFITILSFGIFSIPTAYIFTTGNVQGFITTLVFICFIKQKNKILEFISIFSVASFKPQYLVANFAKFIKSWRDVQFFFYTCFASLIFSFIGFYIFGKDMVKNIKYVFESLQAFTSPPPEFLVHLNSSVIGNISAVELFLFPDNISGLYTIKFQNLILLGFLLASIFIVCVLRKSTNLDWLITWVMVGIPVYLTPVSYNYSLTLFLIPLTLFLIKFRDNDKVAQSIISNNLNFVLFASSLFFIFSPRPLYILMAQVADTNFFNMTNFLGQISVFILSFRIIQQTKSHQIKA